MPTHPYNIGKSFKEHIKKWKTEEEYREWCYKWLDLCIQKFNHNGGLYVM
ncbi:MAG: hypothetical protein J0L94_14225 [Rhodothermia bacterium]|nr:hypothetical protein [Rhodothermia bacterium]